MPVGVGASGFLGIAPEVTAGTYVPPTKYMILREETLQYMEDKQARRPLRGIADNAGFLAGNVHVEGGVTCEVTPDTLVHLLRGARGALGKTGTTPNFIYTFTPNALAIPAKTLSVTVVRNGVVFGYTGCVIGSQRYSIDNGTLIGAFTLVGRDEATQSLPTPVHTTVLPYGAGEYKLEIPTTTQIFDADTFELSIEDNAEPQNRIKDSRSAAFIKYGERTVEANVERDFETRTDYDAYKAGTAQSLTLKVGHTGPARDDITVTVPSAIKRTYEITGLTGQAELIRASVAYEGTYDPATSKAYDIVVKTAEDIVVV
jgi:hypothetical protein